MKLEGLGMSSVKGFNKHQSISFSDLNLIYGANSSGKSSIFQCLLLLHQSASRAFGAERGILEFRGESVDLGGFRTFVHRHDTSRAFSISLRLSEAELRYSNVQLFEQELTVTLSFGLASPADEEPTVTKAVFRDKHGEVKFEMDGTELKLADAESSANVVDRFIRGQAREGRGRRTGPAISERDRRWLREWSRKHACKVRGWVPMWSPSDISAGKLGRSNGGGSGSQRGQILQAFIYDWHDWSAGFGYSLYEMLDKLIYVGPLRDFPRRVVSEASSGVGVGVRGERVVLHLARDPQLVGKVNAAFKLMDIDYRLSVEKLEANGVEDALGDVAVAVLKDGRTGVAVSPADVGFGLSQVLPVIVQLVGNSDALILIEQPEIHLHPRVQSRMADLLLESVVNRGNRVIVETHSEHILARLQRRVREQSTQSLDSGRMTVSFVAGAPGGSSIIPIAIGERGELLDPWPDGFFDERLDDLFAGL